MCVLVTGLRRRLWALVVDEVLFIRHVSFRHRTALITWCLCRRRLVSNSSAMIAQRRSLLRRPVVAVVLQESTADPRFRGED